ncbi:NifB/NifX family molybdenum-iron cluster-binding protein [bacterium]|nr:NifB/NifX family molybdenum-iron cluster-binding protein [bacterium]
MKIVVPTADGKLCSHFGHCETFSFVEIDDTTSEILSITENAPEEGVSCGSAIWIAAQHVDKVLAGGMGGRPLNVFKEHGVEVVAGCSEMDIEELVKLYLEHTLETGVNSCGGEHSHCHGHSDGHHCGHHH